MSDAIIHRFDQSDQGTFGRFVAQGLSLFSAELPARGNAPSISCIPPGAYSATLTHSPRFGRPLYLIAPVSDRTGIRCHAANLMGDTALGFKSQLNGCIALGERLGYIDGQKALLLSAPAMRRFEAYFKGKTFILEIRDGNPG